MYGSADLKEYQANVGKRFFEMFVVAVTNPTLVEPAWKSPIVPPTIVMPDLAEYFYLEPAYDLVILLHHQPAVLLAWQLVMRLFEIWNA